MSILKKILVVFSVLFTFVVISSFSIASLQVDYKERGTCKITPYSYDFNITNKGDTSQIFRVRKSRDMRNWIHIKNSVIPLMPGEEDTSAVKVDPPKGVDLGEYKVNITFFSEDNPNISEKKEICFIVLRDYSMKTSGFNIGASQYMPGETVKYSLGIENDGTRDFENGKLTVKLLISNEVINTDKTEFKLETGNKKEIEGSISLDERLSPGNYVLAYELEGVGKIWDQGQEQFNVPEVSDINKVESQEYGYISSTKTIEIKNKGNSVTEKVVKEEVSFPTALLVTAEGAEVERSGMSRTYRWTEEVEPGESKTVSYKTHYWPVYLLVILLIIITFKSYQYLKAPTIKKKVVKSEVSDNKRVLTVSLEAENGLFGKARNVVIEDSTPSVTRVLEEFDTLEPSVQRDEDETKLRWKVGEMKPRDSRVVYYKVKVLVESADYLKFPKAKIRGTLDGNTFERSSSEVKIKV